MPFATSSDVSNAQRVRLPQPCVPAFVGRAA